MPIKGTWWPLTQAAIAYDREDPGVYELGDANENVVLIGSADNLKSQMQLHLNDRRECIRTNASKYRLMYCPNPRVYEKKLFAEYVQRHGRPPICNRLPPPGH